MPVNRQFGFRLEHRDAERVEVVMPAAPWQEQEGGVVHGGVLTTLADTTAVYLLLPTLPEGHSMASIDMRMDFLRPALPSGGDIRAVAHVVRRGRRVSVCESEVTQDGRSVARGVFTYLFFPVSE